MIIEFGLVDSNSKKLRGGIKMRKPYEKMLLSLLLSALVFSMILVPGTNANANEDNVHVLRESEISLYGPNPPGSGASTHDLSESPYNYQVAEVGYRVFTDKWLTGVSSMKVTVNDWKLIEQYAGTSDEVTISVCKSGFFGATCESKKITGLVEGSGDDVTFTNLSSSTKYYVRFEVPTNGNKYKFKGTISQAN